jgi:hypothetical protein
MTNDEIPNDERNPNDEVPNDEGSPNDELRMMGSPTMHAVCAFVIRALAFSSNWVFRHSSFLHLLPSGTSLHFCGRHVPRPT